MYFLHEKAGIDWNHRYMSKINWTNADIRDLAQRIRNHSQDYSIRDCRNIRNARPRNVYTRAYPQNIHSKYHEFNTIHLASLHQLNKPT